MHVVWFKRDLRVEDHQPLARAAEHGNVCCLYIYEPEMCNSPDWDRAHSMFIDQCLVDLDRQLRARGNRLCIRFGSAVEVLHQLHREWSIEALWSHEETGNHLTYQRDLAVGKWSQEHGIPWHEARQFGVVRRLASRDGWQRRWGKLMNLDPVQPPEYIPLADMPDESYGQRRSPESLVAQTTTIYQPQIGHRQQALDCFESFPTQRGQRYTTEMSSPVTAAAACSRLSPYISYGVFSMREVHHRLEQERLKLKRPTR